MGGKISSKYGKNNTLKLNLSMDWDNLSPIWPNDNFSLSRFSSQFNPCPGLSVRLWKLRIITVIWYTFSYLVEGPVQSVGELTVPVSLWSHPTCQMSQNYLRMNRILSYRQAQLGLNICRELEGSNKKKTWNEKKKDNKQCLSDTHTVMVNIENYYQEYKGHTKWLSLISSHFAINNFFGMTLLHAHAHYICIVYAKLSTCIRKLQ